MESRIKLLRKALGITQEEFSKRIGLARNSVANYEIGRREPTNAVLVSICREFNVSYAWLKDGIGDMFVEEDMAVTATFDRIMAGENETAKAFFKAFAKLSDSDWEVLRKIIKEVNDSMQ